MGRIDELDSTPRYTIKSASLQTGIRDVTLRMWERRYRLLSPRRSSGNYRLYSERDIAILRWVKSQIDNGQRIRASAAELRRIRQTGRWPEALPPLERERDHSSLAAADRLALRLYQALIAGNEPQAAQVLSRARASFGLSTICLRVITPCLYEIGEAWHRGDIRIATEHLASNLLRGHLLALFQSYPLRRRAPRFLVGCAPGERHEIGSLMLALFLRRGGARVEYLGADVDLDDLIAYARSEPPDWVCLSAASGETARNLARLDQHLAALRPRPRLGFGGRAFLLHPRLRTEVPGVFLGETAPEGARSALRSTIT